MRVPKVLCAAFFACLFSVTGCTHYTLKPEAPESMPRSKEPPLPLRVGLVLDEQRSALAVNDVAMTQQLLENNGYAFGPKFAQALRQSKLFQDVRYPLGLSGEAAAGVDMIISAQFGYKLNQDPWQAPKIVLCVFTGLITGAIMSETSHHLAQGVLSVEDATGRGLRTYDETVDVEAKSMVSMFAEMKTMKAGPPAAADNLIAKLVQRLIDDRAFFASRPVAPPPVQAPAKSEPQTQPAVLQDDQI
jgi:hypothetical protein